MIVILVTLIVTTILLPYYIVFLKYIGFVKINYKYQEIPVSFGVFIFLVESILLFTISDTAFLSLWTFLLVIVLIGTIDDIYGDQYIKGIHNHLKSFFRAKITTGFIKAITGGLIAIMLAIRIGNNIFEYIAHFFLILFMINTINIFDLRPGRALKLFFFLTLLLILINTSFLTDNFSLVVISVLLVVFYYDLRGKIMIGDSGSNLIGLHLGIWYSIFAPIYVEWSLILFLLVLHIYTEKYSLTKLIEKNRYLLRIDSWGRQDKVRGSEK